MFLMRRCLTLIGLVALLTTAVDARDLKRNTVGGLGTVPEFGARVTCTVKGDAHNRVYALDQTPGTTPTVWRLSMRDSESGERWVRLPLRGAQPQIAAGLLHIDKNPTFASSNGQVSALVECLAQLP